MANANRPKGLSPVANSDGSPWNQQTQLFCIPSTDSANTYAIGDLVKLVSGSDANGVPYTTKFTSGGAGGDVASGVIVGVRVADPGVSLQGNIIDSTITYVPKTKSRDYYVYVVADPSVIFEVQGDSTVWATTHMNQNVALTVSADQSSSLSMSAPFSNIVATTPGTGATLPLQVLGLVQRVDNAFGANAALLVRFNTHASFGGRTGV